MKGLSKGVLRSAMIGLVLASIDGSSLAADPPTQPPTAAARLNAADDPQTQQLSDRTGIWDVVMTFQPSADAKPVVTKGLVSERHMTGRFLEEIMHPANGSTMPPFKRIAYLQYSRVEGRWHYVSLDTRFPVGIMPAYSFDKGEPNKVTLEFAPIGFVGMGAEVDGKMLRSNLIITHDGKDRDIVEQFWTTSDGTSRKWLGVRYDYRRRP
jgi:hypothetical protein